MKKRELKQPNQAYEFLCRSVRTPFRTMLPARNRNAEDLLMVPSFASSEQQNSSKYIFYNHVQVRTTSISYCSVCCVLRNSPWDSRTERSPLRPREEDLSMQEREAIVCELREEERDTECAGSRKPAVIVGRASAIATAAAMFGLWFPERMGMGGGGSAFHRYFDNGFTSIGRWVVDGSASSEDGVMIENITPPFWLRSWEEEEEEEEEEEDWEKGYDANKLLDALQVLSLAETNLTCNRAVDPQHGQYSCCEAEETKHRLIQESNIPSCGTFRKFCDLWRLCGTNLETRLIHTRGRASSLRNFSLMASRLFEENDIDGEILWNLTPGKLEKVVLFSHTFEL
eukprot:766227-Hanusia_phi.AAC.3